MLHAQCPHPCRGWQESLFGTWLPGRHQECSQQRCEIQGTRDRTLAALFRRTQARCTPSYKQSENNALENARRSINQPHILSNENTLDAHPTPLFEASSNSLKRAPWRFYGALSPTVLHKGQTQMNFLLTQRSRQLSGCRGHTCAKVRHDDSVHLRLLDTTKNSQTTTLLPAPDARAAVNSCTHTMLASTPLGGNQRHRIACSTSCTSMP
ncbi:hypothetical protein TRVL_07039 [Trypanosoma vivax]|nr:hypothetical protein TRVL_07039 [Trypanosoma vivax]